VSGFTINEIDIPETAAHVAHAIQEGAYVAIGLALLALQKAQVQRVQLQKQAEAYVSAVRDAATSEEFDARIQSARAQLAAVAMSVDSQMGPARRQIEDGADRVEAILPGQARDMVRLLREAARRQEQQLRESMGISDSPPESSTSTGQATAHADPQTPDAQPTEVTATDATASDATATDPDSPVEETGPDAGIPPED
jgi:hypothetical protein